MKQAVQHVPVSTSQRPTLFADICHACDTTELRNLRLAGNSKQSFPFELSDNAVID